MVFHGCPLAMKLPNVAPIVAQQKKKNSEVIVQKAAETDAMIAPPACLVESSVYHHPVIEISGKIHIFP
jgi:hypothetical protein